MTFYVLSLSVAGTVQGLTWAAGNPFIASVDAAAPYWAGRAVAGSLMFLAHLLFAYNVLFNDTRHVAREFEMGDARA